MAKASAQGITSASVVAQHAAPLSLKELNTRSAPLGSWDVGVFRAGVHEYTWTDKTTKVQKQGATFQCLLVAANDPETYISASAVMRAGNKQPLDALSNKFKDNRKFRLTKVALQTQAKQQYLHTPLKMRIDIGKTHSEPLISTKDGEIIQPEPKMTLRDCAQLQQAQRFDVTGLVESISEERQVTETRKVRNLTLVDDSGENDKIQQMVLNYFYDVPMLAATRATMDILLAAVDTKEAVSFFAIQGKKTKQDTRSNHHKIFSRC